MWENFTEPGRRVVLYAQLEAGEHGKGPISSPHLLLGLVCEADGTGTYLLQRLGVSPGRVQSELNRYSGRVRGHPLPKDVTLSPGIKRVIDLAFEEASPGTKIGPEHLLLGMIRDGGLASVTLGKLGVDLPRARREVSRINDEALRKPQEAEPTQKISKATDHPAPDGGFAKCIVCGNICKTGQEHGQSVEIGGNYVCRQDWPGFAVGMNLGDKQGTAASAGNSERADNPGKSLDVVEGILRRISREGKSLTVPRELRLLAVSNRVIFPVTVAQIFSKRKDLIDLADVDPSERSRVLGFVTRRDRPDTDTHAVGVAVAVRLAVKESDGVRMLLQGIVRFHIEEILQEKPFLVARIRVLEDEAVPPGDAAEVQNLERLIAERLDVFVQSSPEDGEDLQDLAACADDPYTLTYLAAAHLPISIQKKQEVLAALTLKERMRTLLGVLMGESRPVTVGAGKLSDTHSSRPPALQEIAVGLTSSAEKPEIVSQPKPKEKCPSCAEMISAEAHECRLCGERIRRCSLCNTPNTWLARKCIADGRHILRTEDDWLVSPGGNPAHTAAPATPLGVSLSLRWSSPPLPPPGIEDALEWCASLAAFGMVIASAIDSGAGSSAIHAFEASTGTPLWDFDLPDAQGIYPAHGSMALAEDGLLYAATLGGAVVALDAVRGTLRWESRVTGPIYGGAVVTGDILLVPGGPAVHVLDRRNGDFLQALSVGHIVTAAPGAAGGLIFVASGNQMYAFDAETWKPHWQALGDGAFVGAPLAYAGIVYAATAAGSVFALDARGEVRWQAKITSKGITTTPTLSPEGLLFIGDGDGSLHVVSVKSGNIVRSRRISKSPIRCAPVSSGQTVFVGADDGTLYAMDGNYGVHKAYETTRGARIAGAGLALYGDTLICAATNGVLYTLTATF